MAITKITADVIDTGTITADNLHATLDLSGKTLTLPSAQTATTQSAGDNSTKVATTAYVETATAALVDSAPGTLNTLNELAAALGDDANFSTTVTNSIATKLPLAGGTVTGNITMGGMMLKPSGDGGTIGFNRNPDNGSHVGDSTKRRFQINGPDSTGGDFLQFQAYNSSGTHQGNMTFTDGYLGIGENAPDTFLHVKGTGPGGHGTIKIEGVNAHLGFTKSDGNFRSWIGQYNTTGHGSDSDLNIKTGYVGGSSSTGNIRISADGDTTAAQVYLQGSTGNLGINNTECSAKLHIEENGTGAITSLRLANENTQVGDGSQIVFTSGTSTSGAAIAGYGTALNQADLVFKSGGNSETMRLDSSGNLTIVAGSHTAANAGLTINSPVSNTFNHAINAFSANLTAGESILKVLGKSGSTKNAGYLGYTWNADASNENYVHLSHWGSNYLLKVYGNGNTMVNNHIWFNGSGDWNNYNEGIRMAVQSGNNHAVIAWGAGSAGNVTSGGLPAHSMLYSTASNLYTQRNTAGSTIYSLTNAGALSIVGSLSQNTSDERLKENITVIPNAITKLKGIRGVTFDWKETTPDKMALEVPSSGHDVGVLAQEVQAVLPEAVSLAPFDTSSETYSENDIDADVPMGDSKTGQNYLTVDYQKLVPLLIESIKELEARITELEG